MPVTPDLHDFHLVVINTSGGKDSQAMMHRVVVLAKQQDYPLANVVAAHADLGRIEWDGTIGLARRQAEHFGLRFLVEKRRQGDLLQHFRARWEDLKAQATAIEEVVREYSGAARGDLSRVPPVSQILSELHFRNAKAKARVRKASLRKSGEAEQLAPLTLRELAAIAEQLRGTPPWSSPTNRFCTSDHKRGQISRAYTRLTEELREERGIVGRVKFINCFGFRAQESPARAAREPWALNRTLTTKGETRSVHDWLPIHDWDEDQVWLAIDESGAPYHWAYDRGMSRLSCRFCIFAPRNQLMIAALQPENWELFCEYVEFEKECGFTFTQSVSLQEIKLAIERGERPDYGDNGQWGM